MRFSHQLFTALLVVATGTMAHKCPREHDAPIRQTIDKTLQAGQSFSVDLPGDDDDSYAITQAPQLAASQNLAGHTYTYTAGTQTGQDQIVLTATEQHKGGQGGGHGGGHHGCSGSDDTEAVVTINVHILADTTKPNTDK